jgi:alpha-beta hydrolase superfamily lysophospholipase
MSIETKAVRIKDGGLTPMKRKLIWGTVLLSLAVIALFGAGLWSAGNQLLFPSWKGLTKDLAVCTPEAEKSWGRSCGNLRATREFTFTEVQVPSINGYALPGWLIRTADNQLGPANGAVMLVHGGGSDRREDTRFVRFFLSQKLDVLTFDLGCHGEAPCPVPGMTYGHRESRDVQSAYLYLTDRYRTVYAMGSSVGAAATLIALPAMPALAGAIAENPIASFQRLIREAPEAQSMPGWGIELLMQTAMMRGRFDGLLSPASSLPLAGSMPILFIHSKLDKIVSYQQTQDLAAVYRGPKTIWLAESGEHSAIWDVDRVQYEKRVAAFLSGTASN